MEKYTIGAYKLDEQSFSDKYWLHGVGKYQWHTMDIEDGDNELSQLLINNDRALRKELGFHITWIRKSLSEIEEEIEKERKLNQKCRTIILIVTAALVVIGAAVREIIAQKARHLYE